jgi:signal transduction histidine kinase
VTERSLWTRKLTVNPWILDVALAALLMAAVLGSLGEVETTSAYPNEPDALAFALDVVGTGVLVVRRKAPVLVLLATATCAYASYLLGYPDHGLPLAAVVALYTVASRCERRTTIVATAAVILSLPIAYILADAGDLNAGTLSGNVALFGVAAVWGDRKQVRDAFHEQLELRAADQERERLESAQHAVDEERTRIARELHDVVAHSMSVIAVQSGVAAHVIDAKPDEAKRLLETISSTSRDALTEMRRLLGVLRSEGDGGGSELEPAPGCDAIGALAARVREAGIPVDVVVEGEATCQAVPAGVDLSAYRIVQEALTNVLKHAGSASATVTLRYEPDAVHIEVVDDGRGAAVLDRTGAGHGLVGMRERAALYDGTLAAGPRPGGGFRVAATLRFAPAAKAPA